MSRVKVENKLNKNPMFEGIAGRIKGSEKRAVHCNVCTPRNDNYNDDDLIMMR